MTWKQKQPLLPHRATHSRNKTPSSWITFNSKHDLGNFGTWLSNSHCRISQGVWWRHSSMHKLPVDEQKCRRVSLHLQQCPSCSGWPLVLAPEQGRAAWDYPSLQQVGNVMPWFLMKLTSALNSEKKEMQPWMSEEAEELTGVKCSAPRWILCVLHTCLYSVLLLWTLNPSRKEIQAAILD